MSPKYVGFPVVREEEMARLSADVGAAWCSPSGRAGTGSACESRSSCFVVKGTSRSAESESTEYGSTSHSSNRFW